MQIRIPLSCLPFLIGAGLASGCAGQAEKPVSDYAYAPLPSERLDHWVFDGRLAVKDSRDSWSANVNWSHDPDDDVLKLAGPLGQGSAVIRLTPDKVVIDRGNGNVQTSERPEAFIREQLGVVIPVRALRFWVLGVPEPNRPHARTVDGFTQTGWLVAYPQMQRVRADLSLPRKITVSNQQTKLKLVIDRWTVRHALSD